MDGHLVPILVYEPPMVSEVNRSLSTIFMYRIYWKVSIPRMLTRIEVVHVSDSDTQERETAHKQNEKVIIKAPNHSPIQWYTQC